MALNVLLSAGDGAVADAFDLMPYIIQQGISAPPPEPGERTRVVQLTLDVSASNADALWTAWGGVERMLTRAKRAAGPYGTGTGVTLSVQLDTTEWVYFDVLDGALGLDSLGILPTNVYGVLSLVCLPYARGDRYTAPLSPSTTRTNGDGMSVLIEDIPGDAPALARITVSDVSTSSKVINGVRIGARSGFGLESGDFDGIVDLTAAGVGEALTEASAVGGAAVTTVPGSAWATMADASIPGTAYSIGLYDLYVRMRDETVSITAPLSLTASATLYRLLGSSTAATADPTIALSGVRAGDLMTMEVYASGTITTPSGWTLRASNGVVYHYDKTADGTETSVQLVGASAGNKRVFVYGWQGLAASPFDKTANASGTSTTAAPGTTGTLAQAAEVAIVLVGSANTRTPATSFTELYDNLLHIQYRVTSATTALNPSTTISSSTAWSCLIVTYKVELNGAATSTTANLAAGTYQVKAVPLSSGGVTGEASATVTRAISANQPLVLDWAAPESGSPSTYRLYWNRGAGWKYLATTEARTQGVILTETGATTADPPSGLAGVSHLIRAAVSLPSGVTQFVTGAVAGALANASTELRYLGTVPIPPIAGLDGEATSDALIQIQAKSQSESTSALVVDALWLFPHDEPTLYAYAHGRALTTKRDWTVDTRRDGIMTARLYQTGTTTDAGQPVTNNVPFTLGPGSTQVIAHLEVAGGVSDTADAKADLTIELTPRYRLLRGGS